MIGCTTQAISATCAGPADVNSSTVEVRDFPRACYHPACIGYVINYDESSILVQGDYAGDAVRLRFVYERSRQNGKGM